MPGVRITTQIRDDGTGRPSRFTAGRSGFFHSERPGADCGGRRTLVCVAAGAEAAEIAAELFLSYGTVRNYLSSAVMKVGGRNRVDAVRIAREAGWL